MKKEKCYCGKVLAFKSWKVVCKCGRTYTHTSNGILSQMSRPTQRAADGLQAALFSESDTITLVRGDEVLHIRRR